MSFDQLLAFIKISELGSFQAAAKALHISQPAISNAIKKLEDQLGVQLFDRSSYRPYLTNAGSQLLTHAKNLIKQRELMIDAAAVLQQGHEDRIRIAIGDLCPFQVTLDLLKNFFTRAQGCQMVLLFEGVYGPTERVSQKEAKFGISSIPEHQLDQFLTIDLMRTQLIPVVAPDHPLAKEANVSSTDLQAHVQIVIRDTSATSEAITLGVADEQALRCSVSDQNMKLKLIQSGLGWGRLPDHMALSLIKSQKLKRIKSQDISEPEYRIYAYQRRQQINGPISKQLWEYLSSCQEHFRIKRD